MSPVAAERGHQRDAGDDGRQHQRHGDRGPQQRAAAEVDAREQPRQRRAEQQAAGHRRQRGEGRDASARRGPPPSRAARRSPTRGWRAPGSRAGRRGTRPRPAAGTSRTAGGDPAGPGRAGHGQAGPKPASASTCWPSSDSTRSMNSWARSAFSDCSSGRDRVDVATARRHPGMSTAVTSSPAATASVRVDDAGVGLVRGDLGEHRLHVDLLAGRLLGDAAGSSSAAATLPQGAVSTQTT